MTAYYRVGRTSPMRSSARRGILDDRRKLAEECTRWRAKPRSHAVQRLLVTDTVRPSRGIVLVSASGNDAATNGIRPHLLAPGHAVRSPAKNGVRKRNVIFRAACGGGCGGAAADRSTADAALRNCWSRRDVRSSAAETASRRRASTSVDRKVAELID